MQTQCDWRIWCPKPGTTPWVFSAGGFEETTIFVQTWSLRHTVYIEWNHQRKSNNAILDFGFKAQLLLVNTIAIIYHRCETTKKNVFRQPKPIQTVPWQEQTQRDLALSWASLESSDAAAADLHEGTDPCINSCHDNNAIGGERWRFHSTNIFGSNDSEMSRTLSKKQLQLHFTRMVFTATKHGIYLDEWGYLGDTRIPLRFLYILVLAMPEDSLWPLNILFNILWTSVHK